MYALRSDLIIKAQTIQNQLSYIIKDPETQSYLRLEEEEHFVLSQLDGKRTPEEIAIAYNEEFDSDMTPQEIQSFIQSLKPMNLLEKSAEEQNIYLYEKLKEQRRSRLIQAKGSTFYFRVKVWDPDTFFDKVMPYIHWLWSPTFILAMNLFMLSGLVVLIQNSEVIQAGVEQTFDFLHQDATSLFLLWLTVMCTIAIHEVGHGLTCKRFGGECHEIGFLFMFFTPCMYANVNDAWMFENKRHRLYVTFAGCYIEFVIGFICVYLWLFTQPGSFINLMAFQVVIVAFFSAIFMNFNPLMKFDGYFALSDYLESPNLRDNSSSYVKYLIQKYVFRLKREFDYLTRKEQWILFIYGTLVAIYMANVMMGIGFMIGSILVDKLGRLGIVITGVILYKLFGRMVTGLFGFLKVVMIEHEHFFQKKSVRTTALISGVTLLMSYVAFPVSDFSSFNTTLEPQNELILRSRASGYVKPLTAVNRLQFKKGEPLVELESEALEQKIEQHELDLKKISLLKQQALVQGERSEVSKLEAMEAKQKNVLSSLHYEQKNLTLYAPFDGTLETDRSSLEHTQVSQGQELGRFIDTTLFHAKVNVTERDMHHLEDGTLAYLQLKNQPGSWIEGKITEVAATYKQQGSQRTYQIGVTFPNKDVILREGLEGTVYFDLGETTFLKRHLRWLKKTIRLDLQL